MSAEEEETEKEKKSSAPGAPSQPDEKLRPPAVGAHPPPAITLPDLEEKVVSQVVVDEREESSAPPVKVLHGPLVVHPPLDDVAQHPRRCEVRELLDAERPEFDGPHRPR